MKCPKCGLFNPPTAMRCDCGWDFSSKSMKESYLHGGAGSSKAVSDDGPKLPSSAPAGGELQAVERTGRYKVIPFNAVVSSTEDASHLASQVEGIISTHAVNGWEYVGVHQLQTFKAGSSGCFGLGATPPSSITTEFIVFRR